jgi:DNA-binding NtrC family response regulator
MQGDMVLETRRLLVGNSPALQEVLEEVACAARTDAKTLITGESGVGKEVVANLIHRESSRRAAPFVAINCAGIPDSLLESELFGHMRGSFTDAYRDKMGWIERANHGTIFLDEIGEMSSRMQSSLLRFLENGEIQRVGSERGRSTVDVRIIAATNRDLSERIASNQFREDLYYRLNVIRIAIPPLRERSEDVLPLIEHFVRTSSMAHRVEPPMLDASAVAKLTAYPWPGNVRELKNVVERLVVRARNGMILATDLPREIAGDWRVSAPAVKKATATPDQLYERMVSGGESFWSAVGEPFMSRDITREDLRGVITLGLEHTRGSYKQMLQAFNVAPDDYKRLLSFLRKYGCHLPFQKFRSIPVNAKSLQFHREAVTERLHKTG